MAEVNNASTNDALKSNEKSIANLSIANDSKNNNNKTESSESKEEINKENLNRNNLLSKDNENENDNDIDIDVEMVDNNNDNENERLLLALEKESHSLLDSHKFAKKVSKEHQHLLGALKKPESNAKKVNNNNNNNNNNKDNANDGNSESKEKKEKVVQSHEYIKEFVNDPNKNAIGEKYELTFHPSRTFAYNIYDKFQVLNNFNKKECKEALKRFTNHIQNLEQTVIHKIAKLEIKNAAKKKERRERKEREKREALQNNTDNADNDKKDNRDDEKMSVDVESDSDSDSDSENEAEDDVIDPTKWVVPEWCVPLRADIRTFDFQKLADMQKSLTGGRLFDVIMMDPPWQLASNNPTRGVAIGYSQLDDNIISSIPIPALQKHGLLFIWVINAKYRMALHLFDKWGYTVIQDIAWVKQTVNRRLANGHGFYLQHAKETCLIGLKGDLSQIPNVNNACADVIYSERRGQSQKPEEIYEYIEQLVPNGYYMEIFGRRNNLRNCWVTVGNEL